MFNLMYKVNYCCIIYQGFFIINISITLEAATNIRRLQKEYDSVGEGLRFGLSNAGCSGYKYVLEFEKTPTADNVTFKYDNIAIYVDKLYIDKLKNSVIGWKETMFLSGFDIDNPQASHACGCGESINFIKE